MKVRDLITQWERSSGDPLTAEEYRIRLPVEDAARLRALAEIYPRRRVDDLLTDLLHAALDEIEAAMPYEQGTRVISEDERGDPIFEDAGPGARFRRLAGEFAEQLLGATDRDR